MTTVYSVRAPDGTILDIEGPDGATDEQIAAFAAQQSGTTAEAAPPALTPDAFNAEVRRRAQAGEDAATIRDWAATVKNPASPALKYTIGPELERVVENVRGGSTRPVNIEDTTNQDAIGAALRGGLDALTFNNADEIQAAFQSGAISGEEYQKAVDAARAQRAIDAQTNPTERDFGGYAGTIVGAMAPMGRILDVGGTLSRVARGSGMGAAAGAAYGYGSAQSNEEALSQAPNDILLGAGLGAIGPAAAPAVKFLGESIRNLRDPASGAAAALRRAGLNADEISGRADEIIRTQGREPSLGELLKPYEAEQFTAALAGSQGTQRAIFEEAKARREALGPEIEARIKAGVPTPVREPGTAVAPFTAPSPPASPAGPMPTPRGQGRIGADETTPLSAPIDDGLGINVSPFGPSGSASAQFTDIPIAARTDVGMPQSASGNALVPKPNEVGQWGREIPRAEDAAEAAAGAADGIPLRPFDAIELPTVPIDRIETPGSLRRKAAKFGDIAWTKFRDIPVRWTNAGGGRMGIGDQHRAYLTDVIFPTVSLPKALRDKIATNIEADTLTIGDLDNIRQALGRQAKAPQGFEAANMRDDLLAMMAEQVPETKAAVGQYAALMQASRGAELGLKAATPGSDLVSFIDAAADLKKGERVGLGPGARAEIVAQGLGNPAEAYRLAKELGENSGFQKRFRLAVGDAEAEDLATFAGQQKRGIDAMMAIARVKPDKVESALGSIDSIIDLGAASVLGAGGAFKASLIQQFIAKTQVREKAAEALADQLLNPAKRREALAAIGNLPLKDGGKAYAKAKEMVRNAFMLTAAQIGKDNARMPEGFVGVGTEPNE
jgi:hypothetical protein